MADVSRTIEIIFAGVDNVSDAVGSIGGSLEDFGSDLQDIGQPFADAAEKVLLLEAALAAMAVGGYAYAVTEAGSFNSAMSEINTLMGLSSEGLSTYSADVLEYSLSSTSSMESIQDALYQIISLGTDYADSLDVLSEAENLAVATKAELSTTTTTLLGTMNAYGAGVGEASDYSDAFFTIIQDGATTMPELSASLGQVTSIAAAAGIDFETLGAAVAAMTASMGGNTSEAITNLKAAIQAIAAPSSSSAAAAAELGIEIGQAALDSQGFEAVLNDIYTASGGTLEGIMTMIPSIEAAKAVLILGADAAGTFETALADMGSNTGAATAAFNEMKDNLTLVWQTMENNWNAIWILFGTDLGDQASLLIDAVTNLFQAIGTSYNEGDFDNIIDFINGFVSDLTASINSIAENLPDALSGIDFTDMIDSFETVLSTVEGLFADMGIDLTTTQGLADVIDLIITGITTLQGVTEGVVSAFTPLFSAISSLATAFTDTDTDLAVLVGQIIGFGAQLTVVGGILATGGAIIAGIGVLAGAVSSAGALAVGLAGIVAVLTGPVGLVVALGAVVAAIADTTMDNLVEEAVAATAAAATTADEVKNLTDQIALLPVDVSTVEIWTAVEAGDLTLAQQMIDDITGQTWEANLQAFYDAGDLDLYLDQLSSIPESQQTEILALINAGDMEAVEAAFTTLEEDKTVTVIAEADVTQAQEEISWFDEEGNQHTILVDVDTTGVDTAKTEIEEIPTEKMIEIQLQGDIDTEIAAIVASADVAAAALEWTASIDIADAEAAAETISAAFEAASESVSSLSDTTSSMFSDLLDIWNDLTSADQWELSNILEEQMGLQETALNAQIALNEAQVAYMEARTAALNAGDSIITIDSTGLEPALETIMWQIIDKVQVQASAESADFLLGIS